jgi:acetyltransferase-like isoleucine patch superfamily enzyme
MRSVACFLSMFLPFALRRLFLRAFLGYEIHPTSRIGFAYVAPKKLIMEPGSRIDHLTVAKGLDLVHLKQHSSIGRLNWISAFPSGSAVHFSHQPGRKPQLTLDEHSAVTHRHIIDCTDSISIGKFSTIAGYRTQLLTHSIDLERSRQSSSPISIGNYCFVGTSCVILGGSSLPNYSVLGADSLLNKKYLDEYCLYGGVPAKCVKKLDSGLAYFSRTIGFVE